MWDDLVMVCLIFGFFFLEGARKQGIWFIRLVCEASLEHVILDSAAALIAVGPS